jgi:cytochrome c oxidase subunit 2
VQGQGQTFSNQVMTSFVTPVICLMAVFFVYGLIKFHARRNEAVLDGPPLRNDSRVQLLWIVITSAMVLFLAGFGTYELLKDGAGGGQGPNPIALPAGHQSAYPVQVIGQQWQFTFRYPSFGGFETAHLALPVDRQIELHVTSLDVIHSFWALKLGVKADANPGVDNVVYVTPKKVGSFDLRCAELCGLFHGYMFDKGQVLTSSEFSRWVARQRVFMSPVRKYLPPYSTSYLPDPQIRGG